jgi:hypothetical protein
MGGALGGRESYTHTEIGWPTAMFEPLIEAGESRYSVPLGIITTPVRIDQLA